MYLQVQYAFTSFSYMYLQVYLHIYVVQLYVLTSTNAFTSISYMYLQVYLRIYIVQLCVLASIPTHLHNSVICTYIYQRIYIALNKIEKPWMNTINFDKIVNQFDKTIALIKPRMLHVSIALPCPACSISCDETVRISVRLLYGN